MDDLLQWRPLLLRFDRITVRGPRSKELLQSVDLDAEVVGDPALMLPAPARTEPRDVIGLNVSEPEDAWGGSLRQARAELLAALKEVARRHQTEFRFVVYNPSDYPVASWFAGELGTRATIVAPRNGAAAQRAVAGCQIFVGERLHSLVMAASAGVPTLALEYRPKCLDFQSSIGLESLSIRTDQLNRGLVVDAIDYALEERSRLSASMTVKIVELRTRLFHAQERNLQISRGTQAMPIRGLE
jgi:polysaccharide pyruvyl transferase WcaK-like protein